MQTLFQHKKILILVSASIALYKILNLISTLKKYNAHIKVVMSKESEAFITPLSFESLSQNVVLTQSSQSWVAEGANHISYAKWADVVLIAPATANTIAKIAMGIADNVMLSTLLATNVPKILAPAMNTQMLFAPQTQENIKKLQAMGYHIIDSRVSKLACGDEGEGALADVDQIIFALASCLSYDSFWAEKRVIITGGGSIENIDEVRYISNHSSGKQASFLALALYLRGAKVSLIASFFPVVLPLGIKQIPVQSVRDFSCAIQSEINQNPANCADSKPIVFMAAALADFVPTQSFQGKLKKEQVGKHLEIICERSQDILLDLDSSRVCKVGFKAELDAPNALQSAQAMLVQKQCEMVCLNVISSTCPFGGDSNRMTLIAQNEMLEVGECSKFDTALAIADFYKKIVCQ